MRYDNRGLFSNHFLAARLRDMPQWQRFQIDEGQRKRMREILESARAGLATANEAQTENDLIRPLLDELGVVFDVQTGLQAWSGRSVPDYAVFRNEETRAAALPLRGTNDFWPLASAVMDAKAWSIELDQVSAGGPGRTPAQQINEYLRDSDRPWGVLTNGRTWRLYTRQERRRAVDRFEMELEHALDGSDDEFKLFVLVFGRLGLTPDPLDSLTFADRVLRGSLEYATGIGERLRDRAFRTVEVLARGLARHESWSNPTAEQRRTLYENSLVWLYRLLFVLSAEARGLLPIQNPTYRDHYSLAHHREDVRNRRGANAWAASSCGLFGSLRDLFRLIDAGDETLSIPPYNGGLFSEDAHPFLRDTCCPDPELGEAIFQLAFDQTPEGLVEPIDYRDIKPRDLGTIYEGLLEFRLSTATEPLAVGMREGVEVHVPATGTRPIVVSLGELYLQNDRGDRRASGSYYTPDYIVDYMIENSLAPVLAARSAEIAVELDHLREALDAAGDGEKAQRAAEFAQAHHAVRDRLLDVRVLDPAMGSGHFLVAAMHHISDSIFTDPNFHSIEPDPDGLLLRRAVAERCLFGIDLNPLAVELARLTIWLETVAPDRPLSFLDHHLKVGDALLGARLSDLRSLRIGVQSDQVTIAEVELETDLPSVLQELLAVVSRDARTREDIDEKEEHARHANELLEPYRRVADLWLAVAGFRQPGDLALHETAMFGIRDAKQREVAESDPRWQAAVAFAAGHSFFHWELEFPEAFFDVDGHRRGDAGFDVVIGNPPYEVLETRRSDYRDASGDWTSEGEERYRARMSELDEQRRFFRRGGFPNAAGGHGKLDYYRLFIERGFGLTRLGGALSFIVPRSLLGDLAATGIRSLLWREASIEPMDAFPKDPPECWVFPEAELAVAVFAARRTQTPGVLRVREHRCRAIGDGPFAQVTLADAEMLDSRTLPIPVAHPDDLPILHRIYSAPEIVRFKNVAPCHIGEINSDYGRPHMRGEPTGHLLVRGRHVARYRLDERASVDTATRWIDEGAYVASLTEPHQRPALKARIAKQAINDINDPRRIVAALCPAGRYLVDSCDYLQPAAPYANGYVLAVLASDVAEWRFRMTSSNNNINAYEIDELPFPAVTDWDVPDRKTTLPGLEADLLSLGTHDDPGARGWEIAAEALGSSVPRSALHDAVDALVTKISDLRGTAFQTLDNFHVLLRSLPEGQRLTVEFAMGGWVAASETAFFAELRGRGVRIAGGDLADLRADRTNALGALRPLVSCSDRLDEAVNGVVAALYGIAPAERAAIATRLPAKPAFLPPLAVA